MNQVKAKLYYLVSTGEILVTTAEMQGAVEHTTKEQDKEVYPPLKALSVDEIDYLELEYGSLAATFDNVKVGKVNTETKTLELTYYTQEELNAMQQQQQEAQELVTRASDISAYVEADPTVLEILENAILELELNRTINGGM